MVGITGAGLTAWGIYEFVHSGKGIESSAKPLEFAEEAKRFRLLLAFDEKQIPRSARDDNES